jgi:hypothetical protein
VQGSGFESQDCKREEKENLFKIKLSLFNFGSAGDKTQGLAHVR